MPETRLVIFDLDNTLVMNRPAAKLAYQAAIHYLAKAAKLDYDKLYNHWRRIVQSLADQPEPEKREFEYSLRLLLKEHRIGDQHISPALGIFEKELLNEIKPIHGAKEIVSWLKEEKCLVAVAAGTDRGLSKKKLKAVGLFTYIDAIISTSDVGTMKPHPDYFTLIMESL